MDAEEIYRLLLDEIRKTYREASGPEEVMTYISIKLRFNDKPPLPQSCYVQGRDLFEEHLGGQPIDVLRNVYLCAMQDVRPHYSYKKEALMSIINNCQKVAEIVNGAKVGVACPFESFLPDICFCESLTKSYYFKSRNSYISYIECGESSNGAAPADVILGDDLTLDLSFFSNKVAIWPQAHYIGFKNASDYVSRRWCGYRKKDINILKCRHEEQLKYHKISFYQYGDYVLELVEHVNEPILVERTIDFVDILEAKTYIVPFDKVDSFVPRAYKDRFAPTEDRFAIANARWNKAQEKLKEITDDLKGEKSKYGKKSNYVPGWSEDYIYRRLHCYLEGMRRNGLLDDMYQSPQQSTMLAIAAAISYRLNLYKVKKGVFEKDRPVLNDYENFINKNEGWKPGRAMENQPARSIEYLWSFWRVLFDFKQADEPSKSAACYVRTRIYDNGFSSKLRKQIRDIMKNVESEKENQDAFSIETFPPVNYKGCVVQVFSKIM